MFGSSKRSSRSSPGRGGSWSPAAWVSGIREQRATQTGVALSVSLASCTQHSRMALDWPAGPWSPWPVSPASPQGRQADQAHSGSGSNLPLPQGGSRKREEGGSSPAGPGDRPPCPHQPCCLPSPLRAVHRGSGPARKVRQLFRDQRRGGEVTQTAKSSSAKPYPLQYPAHKSRL